MSAENGEAEVANMGCASCGIAEVDDIKLMDCDDCDLVRYCSDACQQDHRPKHEAMCKEQAAELGDKILFRQPESSHLGDCPICCLPLPIDQGIPLDQDTKIHHFGLMPCCSKMICKGCIYTNFAHEKEACLRHSCPFCRHTVPNTDEEASKINLKRVEANDPAALHQIGRMYGQMGNIAAAIVFSTKAAALGDADAHYKLGFTYLWGGGVEKDEEWGLHHLEEAAIGGHPAARYQLACYEGRNDRSDRAVKHLIIAANLGHDESIQMLKKCYAVGHVSKEEFAAALRGHQAAVDATKSPLRVASKNFDDLMGMVYG